MIVILWIIMFVAITVWYYLKVGRKAYYLRKFPGIPTYPIIGNNNLLMSGLSLHEDITSRFLTVLEGISYKLFHKEKIFVFWIGWEPQIVLFNPEYIEEVLSSNVLIEKSKNYGYIHSWVGKGLLTSSGTKWHSRRKLLTPAFHFRILEDFIPLINEHSMILVEKLAKNKCVDITKYVTLCSLDIISETAMGVKIDVQNNSDSDYVKALYIATEAFLFRNFNVLGWFDFIFYRTNYGKEYRKQLNILHNFTRNVICNRKLELFSNKSGENKTINDENFVYGRKKKLAFLDLLLEEQSSNGNLTDEDIREEVDTFMFAGHDTTAMGITWCLYMIGVYPVIQQRIHDELDSVFGDDKTRHITNDELKRLKYLECCIKESLRLFPAVPAISRSVKQDFKLKNYIIPKGSSLSICKTALHRNSNYFPNPEVFNPERFLPENVSHMHPYAYIPFSAGPRNCIGQRFALLEEKIVIANVMRNFTLSSIDQRDKMIYAMELVIRPKVPIRIIFRKFNNNLMGHKN